MNFMTSLGHDTERLVKVTICCIRFMGTSSFLLTNLKASLEAIEVRFEYRSIPESVNWVTRIFVDNLFDFTIIP